MTSVEPKDEDEEAEQALVIEDDVRSEAAALRTEIDRLSAEAQILREELWRAQKERDALRVEREEAAAREAEKFHQAVEQARVLAEELQVSNEELILANSNLERRIADRTAALAKEAAAKDAARQEKDAARGMAVAEVHHRVGNCLQLVRIVLTLQAASTGDPAAVQSLREAAARVQTIAAVHRRLYYQDGWAMSEWIPAAAYLRGLVRDCRSIIGHGRGQRVSLTVEPGLVLGPERVSTLGLVVIELMANAIRHGGGQARVSVRHAEAGGVEVAVEDSGPGFPLDFDTRACRGLGMRLVAAYAARHGGVRVERTTGGARVTATLPA